MLCLTPRVFCFLLSIGCVHCVVVSIGHRVFIVSLRCFVLSLCRHIHKVFCFHLGCSLFYLIPRAFRRGPRVFCRIHRGFCLVVSVGYFVVSQGRLTLLCRPRRVFWLFHCFVLFLGCFVLSLRLGVFITLLALQCTCTPTTNR